MNFLVVDMTHGGVKLSIKLSTDNKNRVYGYDIYNTLKESELKELYSNNVKLIENINNLNDISDLSVISPVHCPLEEKDYKKEINENIKYYTHHSGVKLILEPWIKRMNSENKPIIEITGVKGKTTTGFILKEILNDPLLLSSLGAYIFRENPIILKKNLSITPANIIETIDMARKISNPKCSLDNDGNIFKDEINYDSAIFESSLGACGIGDIGILTNIIEDYPIARGKSNASIAKEQIFNCSLVVCEYNTLNEYYNKHNKNNINTFAINDIDANLIARNINYSLSKTTFEVEYENLKTLSGDLISGRFNAVSFAPGPQHILNILAATSAALTLEINEDRIIEGLSNFKGIIGRSSIRQISNSTIIEEVNPGLNTSSIEKSINMVEAYENYNIIIGGKYGITCEEIDENKLIKMISDKISNNPSVKIIVTDELGHSINEKINNMEGKIESVKYIKELDDAIDYSVENNKNILLIYRSNYSQVNKR
ncbi:coenzyme F430 synthase [uncultured Methanobrevibacter sp.]|uniref:coenzyme F430 synthase n=1 Tax=uncultured Methanobrevibacter sp. TaxID=253161 RepID=UPI0025D12BCD|nr:coenzyme F430 synthase [uncultured Methanobrevibacter sp.]